MIETYAAKYLLLARKIQTSFYGYGKFNIEVQSVDRYILNNLYIETPKARGEDAVGIANLMGKALMGNAAVIGALASPFRIRRPR